MKWMIIGLLTALVLIALGVVLESCSKIMLRQEMACPWIFKRAAFTRAMASSVWTLPGLHRESSGIS